MNKNINSYELQLKEFKQLELELEKDCGRRDPNPFAPESPSMGSNAVET